VKTQTKISHRYDLIYWLSYKWNKLGHIKGILSFLIDTPCTASNKKQSKQTSVSRTMVPDLKWVSRKNECPSQVMKQIVGKKRWVINIFTRPKTDTTSQPSTSILLQLIPLFENERWKGSPPSIHGWWFMLFGYESSQTYPCALTGYNSLWGTSLRRSRKYISKRIIKFPQVFN
jgi:hypothetical protein